MSESPRLCYTTRKVNLSKKNRKSLIHSTKEIENECMGYAMLSKAKQIVKFRSQRRRSLEQAAARAEPFAVKRLNSYRPEPPSRSSSLQKHILVKKPKPKKINPFRRSDGHIPVTHRQRKKRTRYRRG